MKIERNGVDSELVLLKTALDKLVYKNDELLELAGSLPTIADEICKLREELINALTGRIPEALIPIATHQRLVRSVVILNGVFVVSMLIALKLVTSEGIFSHVLKIFGA